MENSNLLSLKDHTANPAPLGLLAFGMTTVLLNLHNSGFFEMNAMIFGMGIFYGGSGPGNSWNPRSQKGKYVRTYSFHLLRIFLVDPDRPFGNAEARMGKCSFRRCHGRLFDFMGNLHLFALFRNPTNEQGFTVRVCNLCFVVLPAGFGRRHR